MKRLQHKIEMTVLAPGCYGCALPLGDFPMKPEPRATYKAALPELISSIRSSQERSIFLQMDDLHKEDAIRQIAKFGTLWSPEMGIGLYPDQPMPSLWTADSLLERHFDSPIPPLKHTVAHLEADEKGSLHAMETMAGSGGLIILVHTEDVQSILRGWQDYSLKRIQEEAYRAFPVYVPLLSAQTLRKTPAADLQTLMRGCSVYLRESPEDKALVVLSVKDITEQLQAFEQTLQQGLPAQNQNPSRSVH